jgi:hypothetical protein
VSRRGTGCGGLDIVTSGRPFLGDTLRFSLSNTGMDLAGLILGNPAAASPLCAGCRLGLDLGQPVIVFPAPLGLPLPSEPILVGLTLAVQGFGVGSGPCAGPYRVSDTIDFTIQ